MANLYDSNKYLQVSDFLLIQRTLKKKEKKKLLHVNIQTMFPHIGQPSMLAG